MMKRRLLKSGMYSSGISVAVTERLQRIYFQNFSFLRVLKLFSRFSLPKTSKIQLLSFNLLELHSRPYMLYIDTLIRFVKMWQYHQNNKKQKKFIFLPSFFYCGTKLNEEGKSFLISEFFLSYAYTSRNTAWKKAQLQEQIYDYFVGYFLFGERKGNQLRSFWVIDGYSLFWDSLKLKV